MRLAVFALLLLSGCSTVNCNFTGSNNTVNITQPKTVTASPAVTADGNTVPVSALP